MKTLRKIFREYGPKYLTYFTLVKEVIKTYLKSMLYKLLGYLNLQFLLTKQRNKSLNEIEYNKIESIIKEIMAFKVVRK